MRLLLRKNKKYEYNGNTVAIFGFNMFPIPTIYYNYYDKHNCIYDNTNLFKFMLKAK